MNLILLRSSELVETTAAAVNGDSANDNISSTSSIRQMHKPVVIAALLTPNDHRARHIVHHLGKHEGGVVQVGVIGGTQGPAVVWFLQAGNDAKMHKEKKPNTEETSATTLIMGGSSSCYSAIRLELSFDPYNNNRAVFATTMTLILALPFPKRLKSLWPVIASFGVTRIILVRAHLSDPEHAKTSSLTPGVYTTLLEEGMAQGGHTRPINVVVEVDEVVSKQVLERVLCQTDDNTEQRGTARDARIFLDCGDERIVPPSVRDVVRKQLQPTQRQGDSYHIQHHSLEAILAVGPERGWTDEEAALFQTGPFRFESAKLGTSILRVDTAVVAGLALITAALDELVVDGAS